jgi:hypothetical protein
VVEALEDAVLVQAAEAIVVVTGVPQEERHLQH